MFDWPCGISTGCFHQTPIREALPLIRDGGFSLIEICSFPAHLDCDDPGRIQEAANLLRELGLEANSLHAPYAGDIDISSHDPGVRAHSVGRLNASAEAAHRLGCRYLVLHPGPEREGWPGPEEWAHRMRHAAESLNRVASRCRELGLCLLLENMLPHLMFGHASDMLYLLGAIRETNVGTCLDTGHAWLSGDLPVVVHKLSGHLRMLHVNDNRGDRDDHLPPGEGHIDWPFLVRQLIRWRFEGPLILELAGQGSPDEILRRAREARTRLGDWLRQALSEIAG